MAESTPPEPSADPGPTAETSDLRDLQLVELGILLDVQQACEALGIEFFLGEGTLLGAVRHQGFIPWDDDIDLFMRRSEYERFLRLAPPLLAPKYTVQHATTVPDYWSPVIKVRLIEGEQRFRQAHIAHLTPDNGPLVDIFPLDYVPRPDGLALRLQSTYIRVLRGLLVHKLRIKPADNWQRRLMRAIGRLLPIALLHQQLRWAHTLYWQQGASLLGQSCDLSPPCEPGDANESLRPNHLPELRRSCYAGSRRLRSRADYDVRGLQDATAIKWSHEQPRVLTHRHWILPSNDRHARQPSLGQSKLDLSALDSDWSHRRVHLHCRPTPRPDQPPT